MGTQTTTEAALQVFEKYRKKLSKERF